MNKGIWKLGIAIGLATIGMPVLAQDLPPLDPEKERVLRDAEAAVERHDRERLGIQINTTNDRESRRAASLAAREKAIADHPYKTVFDRKIGSDVVLSTPFDLVKAQNKDGYVLVSTEDIIDPEASCLSPTGYCGIPYSVIRRIKPDGQKGAILARAGAKNRHAPGATVFPAAKGADRGLMLRDGSALFYNREYKGDKGNQTIAHIYQMDTRGRIKFHRQFPRNSGDRFTDVTDMVELSDGSFVLSGRAADRDIGEDGMLLHLSRKGQLISKRYTDLSYFSGLLALSDGGYLHMSKELVRYTAEGQELWRQKQWGRRAVELPNGQGVVVARVGTEDNSFQSNSESGLKSKRLILTAYGNDGQTLWETDDIELLGNGFIIEDLALLPDGGIVIFGTLAGLAERDHQFGNHWFLACANSNGGVRWIRNVPTRNSFSDAKALLIEDDGSIVMVGTSDGRTNDNPKYRLPDGSQPGFFFTAAPSLRITKLEPVR